ncbi:MAG: hypothetical protein NDJ90_08920 [Oligoflexia bacterium]|nr:hypothetical protein [Oligoflexia bacterium]
MFTKKSLSFAVVAALFTVSAAEAIELHWSGQFWSEYHLVNNYVMDSADSAGNLDTGRVTGTETTGYYIPAGGRRNASFQTLFLRLRPKLVVNDNVFIKSEWWLGDPVFGITGSAVPYSPDQRLYYSNQSRGSVVSAQRYWAELLSDFGTIQVGRMPLDWGLGLVWNGGDKLWSRYVSTGDGVRLVSKFGAFTFAPAYILYSGGNSIGGACAIGGPGCTPFPGGKASVADYSLSLKYESLEDDFDGGFNFVKRLAGLHQDVYNLGIQGTGVATNFNTWDIYARKRLGNFTVGGEVPITSGSVAGADYSTIALAGELEWNIAESWQAQLRAGHAPGQPNSPSATPDRLKAFFFNPNYRLGNIMFNYQLANFGGYTGTNTLNNPGASPAALRSPFDNPVVNATYVTLGGGYKTQKWSFNTGLVYAHAPQAARAGEFYLNTWKRKMELAVADQGKNLGMEWDSGVGFQWDDYLVFRLDVGLFFPGSFYAFANAPTVPENKTDTVFSTAARVGISF